jgi:hypothetical protein
MTDPFDRLRELSGEGPSPDVDAIRRRARSIQSRRYATLGAAAGVSVLVLAIVVVVQRPHERARSLATKVGGPASTPARDATGFQLEGSEGEASSTASTPAPPRAVRSGQGAAPASKGAAGVAGGQAQRASTAELELILKLSKTTLAPDEPLQMTLTACNKTSRTIEATFPTAQRQDYEVSRSGSVVWHWSHDRAFAQVLTSESWTPGHCRDIGTEQWLQMDDGGRPVGPGSYDVVGVLTTTSPKRTPAQRVCVVPCA